MSNSKIFSWTSLILSQCLLVLATPCLAQQINPGSVRLASKSADITNSEAIQLLKYLKNLEDRFFFHSYDHDPLEKRIERLELLIFGQAKYGTIQERLAHLKSKIEANDREAASDMKKRAKKERANPQKIQQYPIMNTLEWRVLKKTYREESLEKRLDRLEEKLFGKTAPAMSYRDRIDRLKKIVGINITSLPSQNSKLQPGPLPQAGKRRMITPFNGRSFPNFNPDSQTFQDDFEKQFMKDMPNMFKYMDDRMKNIFKNMPNGYKLNPPKTSPYTTPKKKPTVTIPPYADPNSI